MRMHVLCTLSVCNTICWSYVIYICTVVYYFISKYILFIQYSTFKHIRAIQRAEENKET